MMLIVNLYGNLQTRPLPRISPSDQNNASRPRLVERSVGRSLSCAPDRTCLKLLQIQGREKRVHEFKICLHHEVVRRYKIAEDW